MRFSEEEIKRQLQSSMPWANTSGSAEYNMQQLLSNLAAAAESSILEGCPVFISRLKANQKLAQRIKQLMQEWVKESEDQIS